MNSKLLLVTFLLLLLTPALSQKKNDYEWVEIDNFGNQGRITPAELEGWSFFTNTNTD